MVNGLIYYERSWAGSLSGGKMEKYSWPLVFILQADNFLKINRAVSTEAHNKIDLS